MLWCIIAAESFHYHCDRCHIYSFVFFQEVFVVFRTHYGFCKLVLKIQEKNIVITAGASHQMSSRLCVVLLLLGFLADIAPVCLDETVLLSRSAPSSSAPPSATFKTAVTVMKLSSSLLGFVV